MFSHSGKYLGCLLNKEAGIVNPAGICYHKQTNILAVALPDCNQVRIYELDLVSC